jgi:hypothetical protein
LKIFTPNLFYMKKTIVVLFCMVTMVLAVSAQKQKKDNNPVGKWHFEAPYAPEGYTSGALEIALAEDKLSANMSFIGDEYIFPAESMKFANDTLTFTIFVGGEDVAISIKFDEPDKMSGQAVYSGGEVPLGLLREMKKD